MACEMSGLGAVLFEIVEKAVWAELFDISELWGGQSGIGYDGGVGRQR